MKWFKKKKSKRLSEHQIKIDFQNKMEEFIKLYQDRNNEVMVDFLSSMVLQYLQLSLHRCQSVANLSILPIPKENQTDLPSDQN